MEKNEIKKKAKVNAKEEPKEKAKAPTKPQKTKTNGNGELSRYGHKPGTMAALIDDLAYKGFTMEAGIKALLKAFPTRDEAKAKAKISAHIKHLEHDPAHGLKIEKTDDHYKVA